MAVFCGVGRGHFRCVGCCRFGVRGVGVDPVHAVGVGVCFGFVVGCVVDCGHVLGFFGVSGWVLMGVPCLLCDGLSLVSCVVWLGSGPAGGTVGLVSAVVVGLVGVLCGNCRVGLGACGRCSW
jgi:hypothetical protein